MTRPGSGSETPDLWRATGAAGQVGPVGGTLLRMVESQAQVATSGLVDRLDKQAVLETLLDASKPPQRPGTEKLHYLLATPFRYPPLRHGSRFGGRHEPALLYGALGQDALLAEAAYYRLVFWSGMATPPPGRLTTQHAVFSVRYRSDLGLRLQTQAFATWRRVLADPADYRATQALGSAMRAAGVLAFEFPSARDPTGGNNVGLFSPAALAGRRPDRLEPWLVQTDGEEVALRRHGGEVYRYSRRQFEVDGRLPMPAL
ncbi:MAG: RES family NAD+ phosphorylase [Xanthomonadales bacterium]|nr:RES family NAD+ phosphorylase [Xanthomonadales bacterium]